MISRVSIFAPLSCSIASTCSCKAIYSLFQVLNKSSRTYISYFEKQKDTCAFALFDRVFWFHRFSLWFRKFSCQQSGILREKRRNSTLMKYHCPDMGSASDWLRQIFPTAPPIRSTTQIWVVTRNQYGISVFVPWASFLRETSFGVKLLHYNCTYPNQVKREKRFHEMHILKSRTNRKTLPIQVTEEGQ